MTLQSYRDLEVWQRSMDLVEEIYLLTRHLPKTELFGLTSQMRRAAISIPSNIAEGYGRYTPPDRRKFYLYARGSFEETKAWLRKLIRRKIIQPQDVSPYSEIIDELGPKLNAFIRSTK
ncbi:MAG: four helix bundle protein [Chloroflexia bacterium]|nr:four helix bundle protein [Chloroflexia bacterium]